MFCWDCKYFIYDEEYDSESGNELQITECLKDQNVDIMTSNIDCPYFSSHGSN